MIAAIPTSRSMNKADLNSRPRLIAAYQTFDYPRVWSQVLNMLSAMLSSADTA